VVRQLTAKNRYARALAAITAWCRMNRHQSIPDQHAHLTAMMRGHYAYYGITGNYRRLSWYARQVATIWQKAENVILDALPPNRMSARTERQVAAEIMCDNVILAGHLLGEQRDLIRPFAVDPGSRKFAFAPVHVIARHQAKWKSSGTSPKVFNISASSNSPISGLPRRENAMAPTLAPLHDIACARRTAAAA
jgi:hypothetical protein